LGELHRQLGVGQRRHPAAGPVGDQGGAQGHPGFEAEHGAAGTDDVSDRGRKMRRSRGPSVASNPIVIGAITVLVTIVAVTLAYNATVGLPFVPSYNLHVQIANASELQKGDQASIGGALA